MFAHANIQSQIGLKQFVIMATGCTTSSQCKICNIVKIFTIGIDNINSFTDHSFLLMRTKFNFL